MKTRKENKLVIFLVLFDRASSILDELPWRIFCIEVTKRVTNRLSREAKYQKSRKERRRNYELVNHGRVEIPRGKEVGRSGEKIMRA